MRYASRPIGERRQAVYAFIQANPGSTKQDVMKGTGLESDPVRVLLNRACKAGELVKNCHQYSIGVLQDRTITVSRTPEKIREYNAKYRANKPKKPKSTKVYVRKSRAKPKEELKQTKVYSFDKPVVNVVYPEGYKHTFCPGARYEPLVRSYE